MAAAALAVPGLGIGGGIGGAIANGIQIAAAVDRHWGGFASWPQGNGKYDGHGESQNGGAQHKDKGFKDRGEKVEKKTKTRRKPRQDKGRS
jgi:hypothetical protein